MAGGCGARARLHADARRRGRRSTSAAADDGDARARRCPTASTSSATARRARRRGRRRRRTSATRMGGRLCLQLALDRPELVRAARARERVARHRRRRRARRPARRPTSGWRRRSSATASTRSSSAGSRSRCSRRCRATRAGLDERRAAQHRRPARRTSSRVLGQGAQPSNWDRLGELAMPVLLVVGALRHQVRRHRRSAWPTRSRTRASRCIDGAGPRVPPRATRATSLTCSPPGRA